MKHTCSQNKERTLRHFDGRLVIRIWVISPKDTFCPDYSDDGIGATSTTGVVLLYWDNIKRKVNPTGSALLLPY